MNEKGHSATRTDAEISVDFVVFCDLLDLIPLTTHETVLPSMDCMDLASFDSEGTIIALD